MAVYSMSLLVRISGVGMKPLATSSQTGFTAASSYTKHPKIVAHRRRTSTCRHMEALNLDDQSADHQAGQHITGSWRPHGLEMLK